MEIEDSFRSASSDLFVSSHDLRMAIHEAGHVVICDALKLQHSFEYVTIDPREDVPGANAVTGIRIELSHRSTRTEDYICTCLGGVVAEQQVHDGPGLALGAGGDFDDIDQILIEKGLKETERAAWIEAEIHRCDDILRERWPIVCLVASFLLYYRHLHAGTVGVLLFATRDKNMENRQGWITIAQIVQENRVDIESDEDLKRLIKSGVVPKSEMEFINSMHPTRPLFSASIERRNLDASKRVGLGLDVAMAIITHRFIHFGCI